MRKLVSYTYMWPAKQLQCEHAIPKIPNNIPRKGIARPQSQFSHSCVCERLIYFHDRSAYSAAGKYVGRSWEYINRSQTHECGNWDWGRAIPFLGIHKLDFRCNVYTVEYNIKNIEMKARSLNPEMLWEYPSCVHIWHLSAAEHNSPAPLSQWDRRPRPLPLPTLRRGRGVNPLLEQCKEICSERDGGDTCYQRGSTPYRR